MNLTAVITLAVALGLGAMPAAAQTPLPAAAQTPVPAAPSIGANSYVLVDFDSGHLLVQQAPDERVEPASITKLMTSYAVFRQLAGGQVGLEDQVTISEHAWRTGGSRMFVEVGRQVGVEDLLQGVIIQSGNDASVALAEHLAGTEEAFAGLMNRYAQELGMTHTHYVNATGLPHEDQYTTARDTALLAAALVREFPEYYRWYSEKEFTYNDIRQHNRNRLLWRDPSVDGLKTGHTSSAGYCLVTSAMRDGMRLISVVMGSSSENARAAESQALLNYGFRFFETVQLYQGDEALTTMRVWKGRSNEVDLGLTAPLFVTIPRGRYDALSAEVELTNRVLAPLERHQSVGELVVVLDGNEVTRQPLVALQPVDQSGWVGRIGDGIRLWFGGLFGGDE